MNTSSFVVADRDYLTIVGSPATRAFFVFDSRKAWTALCKDKKSTDARAMIAHLNDAISGGDAGELMRFRDYLVSRHQSLKDPLEEAEKIALGREIAELAKTKHSC